MTCVLTECTRSAGRPCNKFMSECDTSLAKDRDFLNAGDAEDDAALINVADFSVMQERRRESMPSLHPASSRFVSSPDEPASSSLIPANNGPKFSLECFIATLLLNLDALEGFTGIDMPGVEGTSMPGEQGHGVSATPEPLEALLGEAKLRDRQEEPCFTGVAAGDLNPSWQAEPGWVAW